MRSLYLAIPDPGLLDPWYTDVCELAVGRTEVALYDPARPFADQVAGCRAVIDQGGSVGTREMIDAAADAGVELYQVLGTGLDHVDVAHMLDRGLRVAHCEGKHSAPALAEHALCLLLALAKQLPQGRANVELGLPSQPMNHELTGRTLLLVGLGASGRELAVRARALGLRIVAVDPAEPGPGVVEELGIERFGDSSVLDELLADADYVSLHLPLTSSTRHIIDRRRIGLMHSRAAIVNVSRGGLIEEEALIEALADGRLAGAGLDVFEVEPLPQGHPLLSLPNVVLTPHTAGVTFGTSRRRAAVAVENVVRIAAGEPLLGEILRAP